LTPPTPSPYIRPHRRDTSEKLIGRNGQRFSWGTSWSRLFSPRSLTVLMVRRDMRVVWFIWRWTGLTHIGRLGVSG
jgi:hypothetical protein